MVSMITRPPSVIYFNNPFTSNLFGTNAIINIMSFNITVCILYEQFQLYGRTIFW